MRVNVLPGRCDCGGQGIFHHYGRDWCSPACLNSYLEFKGMGVRFEWNPGDMQRRFKPMDYPHTADYSGYYYINPHELGVRASRPREDDEPNLTMFRQRASGALDDLDHLVDECILPGANGHCRKNFFKEALDGMKALVADTQESDINGSEKSLSHYG